MDRKKLKKIQKNTCISEKPMIIWKSCDMIAMKREVAASIWQVFRGANVKLGN